MRAGRRAASNSLAVFSWRPRRAAQLSPKVGIIITKKVGKAVVRNRLRRRCQAILDGASDILAARWYVVALRPKAAHLSFAELRHQLVDTVARAEDAQ